MPDVSGRIRVRVTRFKAWAAEGLAEIDENDLSCLKRVKTRMHPIPGGG